MKHVHGEAAAVIAGLGAVIAALTGHLTLAIALLAALTTAALTAGLLVIRRLTAQHAATTEALRDLRLIAEQVQRRTIAAVEKQRLEAGDRHLEVIGAIAGAERLTPQNVEELLRAQIRELDAMVQLSHRPRLPAEQRAPTAGDGEGAFAGVTRVGPAGAGPESESAQREPKSWV